jgi:cyclic 2,3-diphosphoglycerate synthetase
MRYESRTQNWTAHTREGKVGLRAPAGENAAVPVIALIDGEHHPAAVVEALERIERERGLAGVVFCGGEEKLADGRLEAHYGRPVEREPEEALRRLAPAADAVVDLADEPVLSPLGKLRLASLSLHLGIPYEAPGAVLDPPRYERIAFDGPRLAVIGSGKRTGKTAVAGHWASLLREQGADPVIVCMGRGGPAEPAVAEPSTTLDDLLAIAEHGAHAASDYLEDAVLAGVRTVGCRRVGGGLAGEPLESNVAKGAALAASLGPGAIVFEGSGSCIPPVEVDRTVCLVGAGWQEGLGAYRLLRADLALVRGEEDVSGHCRRALRFELRPEPAEPLPAGARVAVFSTGLGRPEGVEAVVTSPNLARRGELAADLDRAAAERCDLYLTELKAAAIDTVTRRARAEGARVVFMRNRPVGVDGDLDEALVGLWRDA